MGNNIDTNHYYVYYHVKDWFDCCWGTPCVKIPKEMGIIYLQGKSNKENIQKYIREKDLYEYEDVNSENIEIIKVRQIDNERARQGLI